MQKIQANTLGNRIKNSNADTIVIIDSVVYTCLGKGKWENSNKQKITWFELGAIASAKGTNEIDYIKK
jgi:hypothetical protein